MTDSNQDRKDAGKDQSGDELSPEELGKVTGGSIPLRPPLPPETEDNPAKTRPQQSPQDDFIKPV